MRLEKAMMGQCRAEQRRSRSHELTEGAAREEKNKTKQWSRESYEELGSHGRKGRETLLPAARLPWVPSLLTHTYPASLQVNLCSDHAHLPLCSR